MPKKDAKTVPSAQIVDAYKTYLFAKKTVPASQIEKLKPGMVIPVDEIDKDIQILQIISHSKENGLQANVEKIKLKSLQKLKQDIVNGETKEEKTAGEKLKVMAEQNKSKTSMYYDKKFIDNLKSAFPSSKQSSVKTSLGNPILAVNGAFIPIESSPSAPKLNLGPIRLHQKFLMRMGMISNCNVTIRQAPGIRSILPILIIWCERCKEEKRIEDTLSLDESSAGTLTAEIEEFCRAHQHGVAAAAPEGGRKFREDE